ncbi:MAG TPA: outer membrane beta-barrel protein [Flavobacteriales bacterium]
MRSLLLSITLFAALLGHAQYQFGGIIGAQYVRIQSLLDIDIPGFAMDVPTADGFGHHAGIWYRSDRSHLVNFRLGLNWSYRTFDREESRSEFHPDTISGGFLASHFEGTSYQRLNYLEMPVQAQYYFWRGAHAELGVYLGRRLFGNIRTEGQETNVYPNGSVFRPDPFGETSKDLSQLARFEFGSTVGVGYDFTNGICVGAGYLRSFTRMEEAKGFAVSYYNQFRVNVGYDLLHPKGKRRVYHKRRMA